MIFILQPYYFDAAALSHSGGVTLDQVMTGKEWKEDMLGGKGTDNGKR